MTDLQARILYIIVQVGKHDARRVPTGEKLVPLLNEKLGISLRARTVSDHVRRLQMRLHCFDEQGRTRLVNDKLLCTEPDSALYLLALDKICKDSEGRVLKAYLHALLKERLHFQTQAMEVMFLHGKEAGYLEEQITDRVYMRVGPQLREQQLYLELLAPKERLSALDDKSHKHGPRSPYGAVAGF